MINCPFGARVAVLMAGLLPILRRPSICFAGAQSRGAGWRSLHLVAFGRLVAGFLRKSSRLAWRAQNCIAEVQEITVKCSQRLRMSYIGTIENGVVVLPPQAHLAEGTKVRVEPVDNDEGVPTLEEILAPVAGKAAGLPQDMAENHDHYLHGTPRKPGA